MRQANPLQALVGKRVVPTGLVGCPELNGQRGAAGGYDEVRHAVGGRRCIVIIVCVEGTDGLNPLSLYDETLS